MNRKIAGLYALVDDSFLHVMPILEQARLMLHSGVRLLQLRAKKSPEACVVDWAHQIAALKNEYDFTFIVNDFADIAARCGADGVHLGQNDASVNEVRKIIGPYKIIGKSTHSLAEAKTALLEHTDYIAVGAIFPTQAKGPDHPVVGPLVLRDIVSLSTKAVVAIGGINAFNLESVRQSGAQSFAVVSALLKDGEIPQNVKKLIAQWEKLP